MRASYTNLEGFRLLLYINSESAERQKEFYGHALQKRQLGSSFGRWTTERSVA